ncbi:MULTISPECIES: hypothetical protein [Amycolatopsis]|uniref:Siderophore-interacting protein C-terminal domain-containing protein n=1 Tax=Amycolatopsis bullii TaxID=941987 RepID=A0ABQ3JZH9_9PSEU|nr:hypothetical protein [Amycolatopsis bullii]GHF93126.1 hypothetical protein GCM10017567_04610 [Amycolatopsis bullii]
MLAERLLSTPPANLRVERLAVLDWYDGPIEGYLRVADPGSCWHFEVVAAAHPDKGPGERHYALSAAPDDVFERLREFLEPPSTGRVWVPRGPSGAEEALDRLKQALPGPALVVRSTYLYDLTAVWPFSAR